MGLHFALLFMQNRMLTPTQSEVSPRADISVLCNRGDDLHPPANVEKMRSGRPLADADRLPRLQAVARWITAN